MWTVAAVCLAAVWPAAVWPAAAASGAPWTFSDSAGTAVLFVRKRSAWCRRVRLRSAPRPATTCAGPQGCGPRGYWLSLSAAALALESAVSRGHAS